MDSKNIVLKRKGTKMKKMYLFLLAAALCLPQLGLAQGTNSGASVTAPFVATPPVIDGKITAGEWDAAQAAPGTWSAHDSATASTVNTVVKAVYSVDGVYFLFDCDDAGVQSGATNSEYYHSLNIDGAILNPFTFGGATDYLAVYVDPANYADNLPNSSAYSYSLQFEPSMTAKNQKDHLGNSFSYTEVGQAGSFKAPANPPLEDKEGNLIYWMNGVEWQGSDNLKAADAARSGGYVMELFFPWEMFTGYYRNFLDADYLPADSANDPFQAAFGALRNVEMADDGTEAVVGSGLVTGMPKPGTTWKVQFARYDGTTGQYVNWVGDTGGFVTRPFGNLTFGPASGTDVRNAMMY